MRSYDNHAHVPCVAAHASQFDCSLVVWSVLAQTTNLNGPPLGQRWHDSANVGPKLSTTDLL